MKRIAIIGGETHIHEVTKLVGEELEIVAALVRPDQREKASEQFKAPLAKNEKELYRKFRPEIVAIANENHLKGPVVLRALKAGCDVVVDKPLAIRMKEQLAIEKFLKEHPELRLLLLLTLRGQGMWEEVKKTVTSGQIGKPAFCHVRMAVQLNRANRPPWFLDVKQSGGVFLDLLIHGIDMLEWALQTRVVAMTATMSNLSFPEDVNLRDNGSVFCELENGGSATIEGQRMLPDTAGADYRMLVVGTQGYLDLDYGTETFAVTSPAGARSPVTNFSENRSVLADWLKGGDLVDQEASLRANRLSIIATESAMKKKRLVVG